MLFGAQKPADITTREGKEKLQADVLAEMQKIMKEETGKPSVDAVYFTSFVMQ
ncbi:flagellar basal body-associated protein FliL [compost metagenome]